MTTLSGPGGQRSIAGDADLALCHTDKGLRVAATTGRKQLQSLRTRRRVARFAALAVVWTWRARRRLAKRRHCEHNEAERAGNVRKVRP
jgi:protein subunit release factor B